MKYLYYNKTNIDPITIKLKKNNEEEIETEELTIDECFKLKETNEYEYIKIRTCGLYYKTSKSSKNKIQLHGEINILEYENGGDWENSDILKITKLLQQ